MAPFFQGERRYPSPAYPFVDQKAQKDKCFKDFEGNQAFPTYPFTSPDDFEKCRTHCRGKKGPRSFLPYKQQDYFFLLLRLRQKNDRLGIFNLLTYLNTSIYNV
jgi:hypothetical protein